MENSERELTKEEKRNLEAMREKAGHLIDRYLQPEDPEMKWIKTREFAHVKTAMGLTKLMMERYGEDAKELLAQFQYNRGYDHGKRMLARVKARGGDIDDLGELLKEYAEDFAVHYQFYGLEVSKNRLVMRIPACHMGTALKELYPSLPESITSPKYWCDYDFALIEAYNPKVKLSRPKWIPAGDPYCEYVWEMSSE